jgi:hypothetical protein
MGFLEDIHPRRFFYIKHFLALRMLLTMKLGKLKAIVNEGWVMASDVEKLKKTLEERLAEVESFFPRINTSYEAYDDPLLGTVPLSEEDGAGLMAWESQISEGNESATASSTGRTDKRESTTQVEDFNATGRSIEDLEPVPGIASTSSAPAKDEARPWRSEQSSTRSEAADDAVDESDLAVSASKPEKKARRASEESAQSSTSSFCPGHPNANKVQPIKGSTGRTRLVSMSSVSDGPLFHGAVPTGGGLLKPAGSRSASPTPGEIYEAEERDFDACVTIKNMGP